MATLPASLSEKEIEDNVRGADAALLQLSLAQITQDGGALNLTGRELEDRLIRTLIDLRGKALPSASDAPAAFIEQCILHAAGGASAQAVTPLTVELAVDEVRSPPRATHSASNCRPCHRASRQLRLRHRSAPTAVALRCGAGTRETSLEEVPAAMAPAEGKGKLLLLHPKGKGIRQ